jgi:hypothetical protein
MSIFLVVIVVALAVLAVVTVPDMAEASADQLVAELDARSGALTRAVDPERRKAALAEILQPFQPGEMYAYVPGKEGIDPATKRFIEEEDEQAAFKLFHLEEFVEKAEPVARWLVEQEKEPPTAEAAVLTRAKRAGLSLTDSLLVRIDDELRTQRLTGFVNGAPANEQYVAWQEAVSDPIEARNNTMIRLLEAAHLGGFSGPKPETPEDLKAAQLLRKAILEVREARVGASTRKLLARIAEAKKQITKAKMLHKLAAANPDHPGAVKER